MKIEKYIAKNISKKGKKEADDTSDKTEDVKKKTPKSVMYMGIDYCRVLDVLEDVKMLFQRKVSLLDIEKKYKEMLSE